LSADLFQGYLREGDSFYRGDAEALFPPHCAPADFEAVLSRLDGMFRLVLERGDHILAAVDRVRSLPLFYQLTASGLRIGPDASALAGRIDPSLIDRESLAEYLLTGYVCTGRTLVSGLNQLQAGQFLIYDKRDKSLRIKDYYRYRHLEDPISEPLLPALDAMHDRMVQSLIASAAGRTLVLPLSGGYDSRLLAFLLKRAGYEKVVCFTYSVPVRGEWTSSQAVAKELGYPWHLIRHDRKQWHEAYHSPACRDYFLQGTNLSSSPHIQDWLAVRELKHRKLIPEDAVFVPGHSGGMPQGANLTDLFARQGSIADVELLDAILARHYKLWPLRDPELKSALSQRIRSELDLPPMMDAETAASCWDDWDWRQRQACFIVNSVRVYDFFGYEWRLPMWERDFTEFWRRVPLPKRLHRSLLKDYVHRYLKLPIPYRHDFPWPRRVANKAVRVLFGEVLDLRYGRFLDFRQPLPALRAKVSSLCLPEFSYPSFIDPGRPLLRSGLNAIQSLDYLRLLLSGDPGSS
jgi:asparagine synthase (glutamine-hydrolysing)